jgi:hypothetical protein
VAATDWRRPSSTAVLLTMRSDTDEGQGVPNAGGDGDARPMKRAARITGLVLLALVLGVIALALFTPGRARAAPPASFSVSQVDRVPSARWSLPPSVQPSTIEIATNPATDSDGYFVAANVVLSEVVAANATSWQSRYFLPPGVYYTHLSGHDSSCFPTCPYAEWTPISTLSVPELDRRPSIRAVLFGSRSVKIDWQLPLRMEAWNVEISRNPMVNALGNFSNPVASQGLAGAGVVTSWTMNLRLAPGTYYVHVAGWDLTCLQHGICEGAAVWSNVLAVRKRDTQPPTVRALASKGVAGHKVRLRYRANDDSKRTSERIRVLRGRSPIAAYQTNAGRSDGGLLWITWRPRKAGAFRFCVQSYDAAGNKSRRSCAPLRIAAPPHHNSGGGGHGPSCDPSYPTVCIPPPPPDLDCADVPYANFPVIGNDPHGFDGDNDGIGCED